MASYRKQPEVYSGEWITIKSSAVTRRPPLFPVRGTTVPDLRAAGERGFSATRIVPVAVSASTLRLPCCRVAAERKEPTPKSTVYTSGRSPTTPVAGHAVVGRMPLHPLHPEHKARRVLAPRMRRTIAREQR
jgi:hypothetical protein